MRFQSLLEQLDRIQNLPTLPAVAMEVNALIEDLDTSVNTLSRTIEKDPVIVSKLLKLVNSAFYGLSSKVGSISHALVVLGSNTVRNAVLSVSVIDAFSNNATNPYADVRSLWRHSIAVALTSRHLAQASRLSPPDVAFVGGLLHDIGKFVLSQFFQEDFIRICCLVSEHEVSWHEAEKREIGVSHAKIGGRLAAKWKLPGELVDAISYHHTYRKTARETSLLILVHAADIVINGFQFPGTNGSLKGLFPEAREALGPILDDAANWFPEISNEIESACQLFFRG
jgi:putative nucleotidyltransferase with HDIG domain